MSVRNEQSRPSIALGFMAVMVGLLVCVGVWRASQRTVLLDDVAPLRATLPDMRLDLNAASASELALLPGLGPALAQRIIDDREARGAFTTVDDLRRVNGIGPAIVERISPHVVIEIQRDRDSR